MARKKRNAEEHQQEQVKPSETVAVINEPKLKSLLSKARKTKKEVQGLNGSLGQAVANAVENDHLHRKAFGWIRQLDGMEPEKAAELMYHFEHMLRVSGIQEKIDQVMELPIDSEEEDPENVVRMKGRQVEEQAGVA